MKPVGYFEGESMTRRKVFAVAGQALGGLAGAAIVLPALGFAVAPIFDKPEEDWQAVGPETDFVPETYAPRVITIVQGIGEAGKSTVYVRRGSTDLGERGCRDTMRCLCRRRLSGRDGSGQRQGDDGYAPDQPARHPLEARRREPHHAIPLGRTAAANSARFRASITPVTISPAANAMISQIAIA